nr:unnamed protein product [Callosobruchus analis]
MKVLLPDWDICRALLVRPIQIPFQVEVFNKAVESIKSTIKSREQISKALSTDAQTHHSLRYCVSSSSEDEPLARSKMSQRKKPRPSSTSDVNPTEARLSRIIANLFHLVSENKERERIYFDGLGRPQPLEMSLMSILGHFVF